jgi:hypothetical protein
LQWKIKNSLDSRADATGGGEGESMNEKKSCEKHGSELTLLALCLPM